MSYLRLSIITAVGLGLAACSSDKKDSVPRGGGLQSMSAASGIPANAQPADTSVPAAVGAVSPSTANTPQGVDALLSQYSAIADSIVPILQEHKKLNYAVTMQLKNYNDQIHVILDQLSSRTDLSTAQYQRLADISARIAAVSESQEAAKSSQTGKKKKGRRVPRS